MYNQTVKPMTSRERVLAALNNEPTDRTPLYNPTSVATVEMFSLLRLLLFMLIITFLLGCGEDELVVPTVTVEFLGYEAEEARFELNAIPASTTELAVLLTFTSDNRDSFHIWAAISKGSQKEVFTVPLDRYVFWDVKILPLEGINLNDYPISDFEISVGRFNGYVLGDPSKATTGPDETGLDGMVLIPAGNFQMGSYEDDAHPDEQPVHTVYVDAFYIDTHEVTVGEYNRFVRETGHRGLPSWVSEYSPTNQHPVVGVSWHDAMAYAQWAGKRLPTEAEWEKAARGGLVGRRYAWGSPMPNGTQCNFADKNGRNWPAHWNADWWNKNVDDGYTYTAPVGSYPANGYGLHDMVGNVFEWCLDEYDEFFYVSSPRDNPISGESIINLTNNFTRVNSPRVMRGGSWLNSAHVVQVAHRNDHPPSTTSVNSFGFRCVRAVTP